MAQGNFPLLAFNRGIVSTSSLARVDLDRVRLSAEVMTNWLPKKQGPMRIRPGTKYLGSSLGDKKATWLEFVNATDDTALIEITDGKMRVWDDDVLLVRQAVDTTVSITDTGWYTDNLGGFNTGTSAVDMIPQMSSSVTGGVKITASSENANAVPSNAAWRVGDDSNGSEWMDTGFANPLTLPSWLNVDFGGGQDTGTGATADTGYRVQAASYTLRSGDNSAFLDNMLKDWKIYVSNFDTGTYATDTTGKWTEVDSRTSETAWAVSEKRSYTFPDSDTGTLATARHYRLYVTAINGDTETLLSEMELFRKTGDTGMVQFSQSGIVLNAGATGATAQAKKRVVVSDTGTAHALSINVSRGPVDFRCGSTDGDDDYLVETTLGTGWHNLEFTPTGSHFHITFKSGLDIDKIVSSCDISDTGTLELTAPWDTGDLNRIRYDQSADVVYVAVQDKKSYKIERRGTGTSWSAVEYAPDNPPLFPYQTSTAKLGITAYRGNAQITSDVPFFTSGHVGAVLALTHEGQSGQWLLGAKNATTDPITVTGVTDTGTPGSTNERRITFVATGTWVGTIEIQRSYDSPDYGFKRVTGDYLTSGSTSFTTNQTTVIDDEDDNVKVYYRAKVVNWTSGAATITATYGNGVTEGLARVTAYVDSKTADVEILSRFSDTGEAQVWSESRWSGRRGYPGSVALHEGRLAWAGNAVINLSVSDEYENFSATVEGESAPISRTLGQGPVDNIHYLLSLLRLVAGTTGSEISIKSSSLDEALTAANASARAFSTEGSANIRALRIDQQGFFVTRTKAHASILGFGDGVDTANDYDAKDLTLYAEDILSPGVVSVAVQRKPDTRVHCVLADGTVAILTYEPQQEIEVLSWSKWVTDTGSSSKVLEAAVVPALGEDAVYYHIERTINGATVRYLERWAKESEANGDTGLSYLVDSAASNTDASLPTSVPGWTHLQGEYVVAWANDTGQSNSYGRDLSPDTGSGYEQTRYYVNKASDTGDTGKIATDTGYKHVVAGLPYQASFKSAKLPYGGETGTALAQMKRIDKMGLILINTHRRGLYFGSDTGDLDPMPEVTDEGAVVDADKVFQVFDQVSVPFPGSWDTDSRVYLRAKSPRPCTIAAAIPNLTTREK